MKRDLIFELFGGDYSDLDDHYAAELSAAMTYAPEPVRAAASALSAHREHFNEWYRSVLGKPDGLQTEWQADEVYGPPAEREARVTGAIRGLRTGRVGVEQVLAEMAACRQQYIATMARGVPPIDGWPRKK